MNIKEIPISDLVSANQRQLLLCCLQQHAMVKKYVELWQNGKRFQPPRLARGTLTILDGTGWVAAAVILQLPEIFVSEA